MTNNKATTLALSIARHALVLLLVGCHGGDGGIARPTPHGGPPMATTENSVTNPPAIVPVEDSSPSAVTFAVPGLTCEGCAWQISDLLTGSVGIFAVHTEVALKRVTIQYDPNHTTPTALAAELHRIGYDGTEIDRGAQ